MFFFALEVIFSQAIIAETSCPSLSHAEEWAVLAVSDAPLGIDLEKTGKGLDFRQLLGDRKNHSEIISTFLAVLELLRLKEIDLIQEEPFGPMVLEPRKEGTYETEENR